MTGTVSELPIRQAAFVTGVSILVMLVAAVIATELSIGSLVVLDDAKATTDNIMASSGLFRTGVFSWLVILVADVLAAWGLYVVLKPVSSTVSLLAAWFRLVYVAMLGAALVNLVSVLTLMNGTGALTGYDTGQLQAQVLFSVTVFNDMWSLALIVFGIHILLLGLLVLKSSYVPRLFGYLLLLAFVGYVLVHLLHLLFPGLDDLKTTIEMIFILPMVVGEVGLGVWLLVRHKKLIVI
jgi:hypothetical protein